MFVHFAVPDACRKNHGRVGAVRNLGAHGTSMIEDVWATATAARKRIVYPVRTLTSPLTSESDEHILHTHDVSGVGTMNGIICNLNTTTMIRDYVRGGCLRPVIAIVTLPELPDFGFLFNGYLSI